MEERGRFVGTTAIEGEQRRSFFSDEWIGDLFEPVYGAEQGYCGPAEYGET